MLTYEQALHHDKCLMLYTRLNGQVLSLLALLGQKYSVYLLH